MVQSSDQGLTQKGFASCWAYLTLSNPSKALEHMMYLGLDMDPALMQRQFAISKTRQQERRRGKDFQGRALFQVGLASADVACCLRMLPVFFWCWVAVAVSLASRDWLLAHVAIVLLVLCCSGSEMLLLDMSKTSSQATAHTHVLPADGGSAGNRETNLD